MKLEHVGIAVKDLEKSKQLFDSLFGFQSYKTEEVASEKVSTVFYKTGDSKIELVQASDPESAIAIYIEKRGEGLHHIAFEVEDIYKEVERLTALGFQFTGKGPFPGADNKLVCFLHPKSCNGVLIELCQTVG